MDPDRSFGCWCILYGFGSNDGGLSDGRFHFSILGVYLGYCAGPVGIGLPVVSGNDNGFQDDDNLGEEGEYDEEAKR